MGDLININQGIDSIAKSYLAVHSKGVTFKMDYGKKHFPDSKVYDRFGTIPSIELKRYPLKDGTYAEEFVQAVMKTWDGRRIHFLGLRTGEKFLIWPFTKIRSKMSEYLCGKN